MPEGTVNDHQTAARVVGRDGRLDLVFSKGAHERTHINHQRASYPFHICRAQYVDHHPVGMATLYTQSCSGGIFKGDKLGLDVVCEEGAQAHLTTQASTIVHRTDNDPALMESRIQMQPGSYLELMPDPVILFPQASLTSRTEIHLGQNADLLVAESFLAHAFPSAAGAFGRFSSEISVYDASGSLLALDRLVSRGDDFGAPLAGVMGRAACHGTLMWLSPGGDHGHLLEALRAMPSDGGGVQLGISMLPGNCGIWCRILAPDGAELSRTMLALWRLVRRSKFGSEASLRRK